MFPLAVATSIDALAVGGNLCFSEGGHSFGSELYWNYHLFCFPGQGLWWGMYSDASTSPRRSFWVGLYWLLWDLKSC